jgi:hypothetical protein
MRSKIILPLFFLAVENAPLAYFVPWPKASSLYLFPDERYSAHLTVAGERSRVGRID